MQANKPNWPADDCYHGCCDEAAKPKARKEIATAPVKAPAQEAPKEVPTKSNTKVAEATAEAKEIKIEDQVIAPAVLNVLLCCPLCTVLGLIPPNICSKT